MLTRAYDAIMASLQVPMIFTGKDYNGTTIDDSVLNCKDYNGNVRNIVPAAYFSSGAIHSINIYTFYVPFSMWSISSNYSCLLPDDDASDPNYEDYMVSNGAPSGWTSSSTSPYFEKTYDHDTKEIVCSVKMLWQNTSGAAKTVYGVKVRSEFFCRHSSGGTSTINTYFLVCREHFTAPVVVEDQGIISLTFTWRVGRAGLVSATAAAAE